MCEPLKPGTRKQLLPVNATATALPSMHTCFSARGFNLLKHGRSHHAVDPSHAARAGAVSLPDCSSAARTGGSGVLSDGGRPRRFRRRLDQELQLPADIFCLRSGWNVYPLYRYQLPLADDEELVQ